MGARTSLHADILFVSATLCVHALWSVFRVASSCSSPSPSQFPIPPPCTLPVSLTLADQTMLVTQYWTNFYNNQNVTPGYDNSDRLSHFLAGYIHDRPLAPKLFRSRTQTSFGADNDARDGFSNWLRRMLHLEPETRSKESMKINSSSRSWSSLSGPNGFLEQYRISLAFVSGSVVTGLLIWTTKYGYKTYFRRISNSDYITPSLLRKPNNPSSQGRMIKGFVTRYDRFGSVFYFIFLFFIFFYLYFPSWELFNDSFS